jgi:3-dehydroquinate synthase
MAEIIAVSAPGGDYDIVIEPGLLANIAQNASKFGLDGRVMVVTNTTVGPLYGETLVAGLPNAALIIVPDGEQYKTLSTISDIYNALVENGADRHTTIIGLGGGVIGDVAGFAAATYMRGVRFVQMPTSLLAMVDSSVGAKVGVDLPQGKNLVGAFKQPAAVLIDPDVLQTLPPEEWRCGMGEIIKHGLLADEGLLDSDLHQPKRAPELVRRALQVKVDVVQQDPYERGIRAHLNLGHTFAHAIENVTNYEWTHGEAVGFGLLAATKLSHALGLCDDSLVSCVDSALSVIGLPRKTGGLDANAIYAAMKTDKKWKDGKSRFVLLRAMGEPCIVKDVAMEKILMILEEMR